jgi:hypothetical protein
MSEYEPRDFDQEDLDKYRKEFDITVEESDEFKENMRQSLIWDITRNLVPEGENDRDTEAVVEFSNFFNNGQSMSPEECLTPKELIRYNQIQRIRRKLRNLHLEQVLEWATKNTKLFEYYKESKLKNLKARAYRGLKYKIEKQLRGSKSIN